ncbi:MAG TPA: tetratricopeptide repeat protein [Candidatus Udaeobacter sp.]|nr:tetratricopeptide repeat protein [Candidatus Udaeobacter sp.]
MSQDKSDAYFADGVQDQILTNLAKVSDLKVISHTSVRQYKIGGERNMREIGRQLGVAYIMEGSVQRARDRLRINATLIDARTNLLFFFDLDPRPDRISLADAAVKAALHLRPDSSEAHFARADYYFRCLRDYDRAQEELAIARPGLPNSTPFFILSGYITRRRNHFRDAEQDFSTAFALDPRNPKAYNLLADTYVLQRRFPEAVHIYDKVLSAGEQTPIVRYRRASCILFGTGNTGPLRDVLTKFPDMEFAGGQTPARCWMAMLDGNYAEAERVLVASPRQDFQDIDFSFYFPKSWYQAMVARAKGDSVRAAAAFRECREILAQ